MFSLRICRLVLSLSALLCTSVSAQRKPLFTSPLPTGVRLDPAGEAVDLGSLPINLILTPEKDRAVVVLSGWREQGVQVVDLKTRKVTQTLLQDGAFYGAAFSPDGHRLCVSGGNTDIIFVYAWKDGAATLENKFELAKAKTADATGTSYPAGLAFVSSFVAFSHGSLVSDEPHAPGVEIGRTKETFRRVRIESKFGKLTALVTDGHLPYPYGREMTGYEVTNLTETLTKAKAGGVDVLVPSYKTDERESALVQFPGGYIAEIHSVIKK